MKVCIVRAMVFPVVMYGCKSLTTKQAGRQSLNLWATVGDMSPGLGNGKPERTTLVQFLQGLTIFFSAVEPFYRSEEQRA